VAIADAQGLGTIVTDDVGLSIGSVAVEESDSGAGGSAFP
jgi:hypothetical protein